MSNTTTAIKGDPTTGTMPDAAALMVRDAITAIEQRCLMIGPETTTDQIADIRNRVKHLAAEARRVTGLLNQMLIDRITETRRDVVLPGGIRLYIGNPPKYKVRDNAKMIEAILRACGGDVEALGDCLSSDWFKVSQVRSRLEQAGTPELFDELVETIRDKKIEEGKGLGKLIEDTGFRRK